ncbi:MAG: acetolactate synthase large subunit, biosynthetic type, acetolactate synthase I/II/III large subunit [Candidatus Peregrinibacteria bacterium GW2011_GWF2_33_10]|nr:MAG: acetolactate synthase large subunit, biosynthetic type, acetolactate synthase I/II/III large subunit [Candidatus Peregrinibacteria bacterium GW2011_GWF2_33_10]OGJ44137.1 MAG: acetolactate synthase, large subunit, biosynthetic type [Candidatus Peregrinibacteria bacterium RIFOXYA12_FULL_33_12]OGJ45114.1 MAG: acetolactate synthase, large subunit, biosynthetic type [Candidatus Peregrinibacteria bacterium RIFOXYA2_FULL_33_21]OGJ50783.1 MAG: acetolactate synthase, large subunit, biosynthetic t
MNKFKKTDKNLTGAHIMAMSLIAEGVTDIFGYPGGAIIPFYDVLTDFPEIRHILVRHEQAAALAAIGYSRVTGHKKIGVCLATSGPGATNLVTGIYDAYMDSMPIIAITGQVPTFMIGTDAFQEADMIGITQPITKNSYLINDAEDIPKIIKEAFHIAKTGRPGPVLIDFPKDVQNQIVEKFEYPDLVDIPGYKPNLQGNKKMIKEAAQWIKTSKKPVIIAGHGVLISNAMLELMEFVNKTNIPVITTLHGLGAFPENHKYALGMLGMHGFVHSNYAVQEADLIIGIGTRFDDRIIGKADNFAPNAHIIHIDIDPAEIGKNVHCELPIVGDARNILIELNQIIEKPQITDWHKKINEWRKKYPLPSQHRLKDSSGRDGKNSISMRAVIAELYNQTKGDIVLATDVGQHQMIVAQQFQFKNPNQLLTSGGSGTMGYSIPAGMGAKIAEPKKEVWVIVGDGSVMMNIQELVTLMQDNIPIKIAILNNSYLGMVRQWQELFFDKNYSHTALYNPDFKALAEACGMKAYRAKTHKEMIECIKKMRQEKGPVLCDFVVEHEENVYPMVPAGKSLDEVITGL